MQVWGWLRTSLAKSVLKILITIAANNKLKVTEGVQNEFNTHRLVKRNIQWVKPNSWFYYLSRGYTLYINSKTTTNIPKPSSFFALSLRQSTQHVFETNVLFCFEHFQHPLDTFEGLWNICNSIPGYPGCKKSSKKKAVHLAIKSGLRGREEGLLKVVSRLSSGVMLQCRLTNSFNLFTYAVGDVLLQRKKSLLST